MALKKQRVDRIFWAYQLKVDFFTDQLFVSKHGLVGEPFLIIAWLAINPFMGKQGISCFWYPGKVLNAGIVYYP